MNPWESAAEAAIREAMERGAFEHLPGAGRPLDLTSYFETPQELRVAYALLKNAGFAPPELELLQEIAALGERAERETDPLQAGALRRQIQARQLDLSLRMERKERR